MIPVTLKKKKYFLPSSWDELPMWKLAMIHEIEPHKLAGWLIDYEGEGNIDITSVLPHLDWLDEPINLSEYEPSPEGSVPAIGSDTWARKIQLQSEAGRNKPVESMLKIVSLYMRDKTIEEWGKEKIDVVCPLYLNIMHQLKVIVDRDKLLSDEATPDQKAAGIEVFNQFGIMNSIDTIAGGDVLKYDLVVEVDYNTIFAKLYKLKLTNKFTTSYKQVLHDKTRTK